MKKTRVYLPATEHASRVLGTQIAAARRELGWTQQVLGGRLGVDRHLVAKIESGSPNVTLGVVLEAAIVCGLPIFGVQAHELSRVAGDQGVRLALLPSRVRGGTRVISNDF